MDKKALTEYYSLNSARFRLAAGREKKILLWLSFLRLIIFISGSVVSWICFTRSVPLGAWALLIFFAVFLAVIKMFSIHTGYLEHFENLVRINDNELLALSGNYSVFGDGSSFIDQAHDFSYDVDLFGRSSLFQYLNRTSTGYGQEVLAGWLSDPFKQAENLTSRQETIREIASKPQWRQEFLATALNKKLDRENIAGVSAWLNEEAAGRNPGNWQWLIWILPAVNLLTLVLVIAGTVHYSIFVSIFLLCLLITLLNLRSTGKIHNDLTGKYRFLSSLGNLIALFEKEEFKSTELTSIQLALKDSAYISMSKLSRIIQAFDSRMNVMVGFVLNGLLLWDLHCVHRLSLWKEKYGREFPEWLLMLGKIDACISLGNYSFNNQAFNYPVISDDGNILKSKRLGHQLIEEKKRICNDFTISSTGKICIISGANMAGKSTFLRTVAVNYILAMTGAPVCADEMAFTPMKLFTSMRTTDSLSTNESYFYAELRRLKILKSRIKGGENILFILDEILKGTNSEDKSTGSKLFLKKLISLNATGLIATHDTTLGTLKEEFPDTIINKCIEVEIDGEEILFDYLLRDGITTKKNAVLLMRQMGILD